jgi:hypothetical protein
MQDILTGNNVIARCRLDTPGCVRSGHSYGYFTAGNYTLMMEAVRTSETSVDNHFTRQCNPEDSSEYQLQTLACAPAYFCFGNMHSRCVGEVAA